MEDESRVSHAVWGGLSQKAEEERSRASIVRDQNRRLEHENSIELNGSKEEKMSVIIKT